MLEISAIYVLPEVLYLDIEIRIRFQIIIAIIMIIMYVIVMRLRDDCWTLPTKIHMECQ